MLMTHLMDFYIHFCFHALLSINITTNYIILLHNSCTHIFY